MRYLSPALVAALFMLSTPSAYAQTALSMALLTPDNKKVRLIATQPISRCVLAVAKKYKLDPYLIWSIKRVESGKSLKGDVVGHNKNGTRDIGLMQTNTIHLKKLSEFGITEDHLKQPCISLDVAGWMLSDLIERHGVREGVGRYHSKTPKYKEPYIKKVFSQWSKLVAKQS